MFRQTLLRQARLFSTNARVQKSATDTVKDTLKSVDRTVSDAAVKGIEKSQEAAQSVRNSVGSSGVGESHATGQSYVPKPVQKAAPGVVEDVLPNAVHDTSGRAGTAANKSGAEISGQAKGAANEYAGEAKGKAAQAGMDQSHATGQSYVPESVQKVAPEAVEDALPNAVHDTSGRSGTAANQSGSEIAGQAKGKANELAGQAKGKASEVQGKMS